MKHLYIHPEVQNAIDNNLPVVALESTIISHGMPYPENVETAMMCEEMIRKSGAIPATIAIIDGVITVGLTKDQIQLIAKPGIEVIKVSRRDLPYVVSQMKHGALTVSATMIASSLAGIKFFATGGIGGVHREAEVTMDISADLQELGHTSVCVVSAGVKSILDIEKTLEYLETLGVPVIGYDTVKMPAFYTNSSVYDVPITLSTPEEVASFLDAKWSLGLVGGALVANPIPEAYSFDPILIQKAIDEALLDAKKQHVSGKETTPFLLKKIVEFTGGESLKSNIQLVYNNAYLAGQIAKAYFERSSK